MPNMLRDGLAWLTGQLRDYASEVVTATFGAKLLQLDDGSGGIRVEYTDLDFCIPADQLDFGAGRFTPERGDLIDVTMPYDTQTFEVFPFGSDPPWRWSDPHQSMVRVHTKHIDTEQFYP
jgi:hypothetical protein